jgi:hypothetical protein
MRTAMMLLAISLAAVGCKKSKSGAAGEALAKMESFQKSMCDCKDKACADKVNEDMSKWGTEMAKNAGAANDEKPDPDMAKKSADVMTKYTECMTKLMMAGAGAGTGSADAGSGSAVAAGSGSDAGSAAGSAAPPAGELMTKGGGHCPSMVLGAETKAEVKGKDVVLTITAGDKDAIAAIQKRAEELLKEKADAPGGTVHDQKGSQGGSKGICPVFWEEGGKAASKKDAKGVIITITPKDKPEALKATIDGRIVKATEWVKANIKPGDAGNKGAVGGGGGDHGSDHSGSGDGKGKERKDGKGGGAGTGGGGGAGTGGGGGKGGGDAAKPAPATKPAPAKPADKAAGGW